MRQNRKQFNMKFLIIGMILASTFILESCLSFLFGFLDTSQTPKDISELSSSLYSINKMYVTDDGKNYREMVKLWYSDINRIAPLLSERGYELGVYESGKNYGLANRRTLFLLCNMLSEIDELEPAYLTKNGTPLKTSSELDGFIFTNPYTGGWYLPVKGDFSISSVNSDKVINSDFLKMTSSGFIVGGAFDVYRHSDTYGNLYGELVFTIERMVDISDTSIVTNTFDGRFHDYNNNYVPQFQTAQLTIPQLLNIYSMSISRDNPTRYVVKESDLKNRFITAYESNLYFSHLGITEEMFHNMLSEAVGAVPSYYTLDGQVYRDAQQDFYAQHTNGYRKATSSENRIAKENGMEGYIYVRNVGY